ncbi:hypothetical protein H0H87_010119, partial [Tephrocybe sp. NHM501043]
MVRAIARSGSIALDASGVVLSTLSDAARLAPMVPYLQDAAGLALKIVGMIK